MKILQMMFKRVFYTSNFEINKSLPSRKNKKVIGFMREELG